MTQIGIEKRIKISFMTIANVYNSEQTELLKQFCLCLFYPPAMGKDFSVWQSKALSKEKSMKKALDSPKQLAIFFYLKQFL